MAFPLQAYKRASSVAKDCQHLRLLLAEHRVAALVVGLPLTKQNTEDTQTAAVRRYAAGLAAGLNTVADQRRGGDRLGVLFWDERFTTQLVLKGLRAGGVSAAGRKARRDTHAAVTMLQEVLDAIDSRHPR